MHDFYEDMRRVSKYRKDNERQNLDKLSKERLYKIIEKKLKTSFIGALDKFEQEFGRLWGHGKDEEDLTDNQLDWRIIWEAVRNRILNNGNNQIRAIKNELDQYKVNWNRYQSEWRNKNEE